VCVCTFHQLYRKQVQLFHSFLQLVLGRRRHGVDVVVTPIIVLVGVGGEHLHGAGGAGVKGQQCVTVVHE